MALDRDTLPAGRRDFLTGVGASLLMPGAAFATVGKGQRAAVVTSASQPIILVIAGQSNMIYGIAKTTPPDIGSTEFFQMYSGAEGAANTISPGAQNDPLDFPDTTGQTPTPAIGPSVHFMRDYFAKAFHPSRVLFLPCAYGGTPLVPTGTLDWGVTAANNPSQIGSLTSNAITRITLAKHLWPTAKPIFMFEDVEQDFDGYSSFVANILCHFRGALNCWLLYMRQQMAAAGFANFPIVIGRPNPWALTIGGDGVSNNSWLPQNMVAADIIIRATANRFPYVGIADSMNPTQATYQASPQSIHYDEAGQITMAGRYWTGYQQAISNTNFTTSPVWDALDYLQTSLGYANGFTVGSGGSTLSNGTTIVMTALATCPNLPSTSSMVYAEVKVTANTSGNILVGLANQSVDFLFYLGGATSNTSYVVQDYSGAGLWTSGSSLCANGSTGTWAQTAVPQQAFAVGDVIQLALNRATGRAWVGYNNTWLGSGNPSAGTNPWLTGIPQSDMVFIAASITTATIAIQGKAAQYTYSPPSGFLPWGH